MQPAEVVVIAAFASASALEALIDRIRSRMTVLRSITMIALSAVKEDGPLLASAPGAGNGETRGERPEANSRRAEGHGLGWKPAGGGRKA